MGFSSVRFLKPLDANLMCAICSGVLDTPVLTPCGHTFCEGCITKWMETPGVKSCPECRSAMERGSTRPILSLRNLIGEMQVTCPNKSRGCNDVIKIENENTHLQTCSYDPVTCVGCNLEMNKAQLPVHQMDCSALIALLQEEVEDVQSQTVSSNEINESLQSNLGAEWREVSSTSTSQQYQHRTSSTPHPSTTSTHLLRLLHRVSALEKQVARLLDDLQEAHFKNSLLYLQNKKLKEDEDQRHQNLTRRLAESQPQSLARTLPLPLTQYDCNTITNQHDIAKLSLYIARNLIEKPANIDSDRVFTAVRKCYEMHFYHTNTNSRVEHDVHMLLATAFACTWFNSAQRITLGCWLQCVHKCQGCRQVLQGET